MAGVTIASNVRYKNDWCPTNVGESSVKYIYGGGSERRGFMRSCTRIYTDSTFASSVRFVYN